jgi:hypothetical protein
MQVSLWDLVLGQAGAWCVWKSIKLGQHSWETCVCVCVCLFLCVWGWGGSTTAKRVFSSVMLLLLAASRIDYPQQCLLFVVLIESSWKLVCCLSSKEYTEPWSVALKNPNNWFWPTIATVIPETKKTLKEVVKEPTLNWRFLSWLLVIGPWV